MNTVRINAYAKLNLTLDILGVMEGYHQLDSLVTTVDVSDRIVAKKRKDSLISVTMRGLGSESIPPEQNNAQKAGERFVEVFQTQGANITIFKNIPMGAGMGGSSADAAGVLNALAVLYQISDRERLKEIADRLGSDTGYLLDGGFARMQGRGEQVTPLGVSPKLHFLLLVPKKGVSTAECYRLCDEFPPTPFATEGVLKSLREGKIEEAASRFSNGLYPAAIKLNPDVERAYADLQAFSPWGVSMTGSGSAVFALFESAELCEWAKSRYQGKCRAYVLKTVEQGREKNKQRWRNPFVLSDGESELL